MTTPTAPAARDLLLVALAVVTGATDAATFLALGQVFSSVITGNLVLLGIGGAHADGSLLSSSCIALVAYAIGVALVAPWVRSAERDVIWPRAVNHALAAELTVLMVFTILWELSTSAPSAGARHCLLALAATAMGMQSETVRSLGSFSTTYLTSTLTGLVSGVVRHETTPGQRRSIAIITVAIASAAAAAGLLNAARPALPALQCLPLLLVLWTARRFTQAP